MWETKYTYLNPPGGSFAPPPASRKHGNTPAFPETRLGPAQNHLTSQGGLNERSQAHSNYRNFFGKIKHSKKNMKKISQIQYSWICRGEFPRKIGGMTAGLGGFPEWWESPWAHRVMRPLGGAAVTTLSRAQKATEGSLESSVLAQKTKEAGPCHAWTSFFMLSARSRGVSALPSPYMAETSTYGEESLSAAAACGVSRRPVRRPVAQGFHQPMVSLAYFRRGYQ